MSVAQVIGLVCDKTVKLSFRSSVSERAFTWGPAYAPAYDGERAREQERGICPAALNENLLRLHLVE